MNHRIDILESTAIVGKSKKMSMTNDHTRELWQGFMPLLKTIENRKGSDLISLQKFDKPFNPISFDPSEEFTKWAGVPVKSQSKSMNKTHGSSELGTYVISGGLYGVFEHRGPASEFGKSMEYIFGQWLPNSSYELDHRESFEILPESYRPDDPNAKEEIWIPIRKK